LFSPFHAPGHLALKEESHPSEDLPAARRYLNREARNAKGEVIKRPGSNTVPILLRLEDEAFALSGNSFAPHHEVAGGGFGAPCRPFFMLFETNPPRKTLQGVDDLLQSDLSIGFVVQRNEGYETRRSAERFISCPFGDIDNVLDVQRDNGYVRRKVEENEVAEQRRVDLDVGNIEVRELLVVEAIRVAAQADTEQRQAEDDRENSHG
jgi:hypothetical protein